MTSHTWAVQGLPSSGQTQPGAVVVVVVGATVVVVVDVVVVVVDVVVVGAGVVVAGDVITPVQLFDGMQRELPLPKTQQTQPSLHLPGLFLQVLLPHWACET